MTLVHLCSMLQFPSSVDCSGMAHVEFTVGPKPSCSIDSGADPGSIMQQLIQTVPPSQDGVIFRITAGTTVDLQATTLVVPPHPNFSVVLKHSRLDCDGMPVGAGNVEIVGDNDPLVVVEGDLVQDDEITVTGVVDVDEGAQYFITPL